MHACALFDQEDFAGPTPESIIANNEEKEHGKYLGGARGKILKGPPNLIFFGLLLDFLADFHCVSRLCSCERRNIGQPAIFRPQSKNFHKISTPVSCSCSCSATSPLGRIVISIQKQDR